ncbi:MAG: hypothetical protein AAF149_21075 [Bacteroidota bacterium]
MNSDSLGWLKSVLIEARGDVYMPTNQVEHADEQIYHIADPWVICNKSVTSKKSAFQNACRLHYAKALNSIYLNFEENQLDPIACSHKIYSFLKIIYPDLSPSIGNWFTQRTNSYSVTEKFISKRIAKLLMPPNQSVWYGFYNNAQLFLDFYLFRLFCFAERNVVVSNYLRDQKDLLNFSMLCIIAGASHANTEIANEEVVLFNLFLKRNFINEEHRKAANEFIENGASPDQIELPANNSWALRKFFLELAIATVWSDGILDEQEEKFVKNFSQSLQLSDTDVISSHMRIESFLISLMPDGSQDNNQIEHSFLKRINKLLTAYNNEIIHLLKSNSTVCQGLKSSSIGHLSEQQKDQLAQDIIKLIQHMNIFRGISFNNLNWSYLRVLKIMPKGVIKEVIS